jgi:hypothetical protein
MFPSCSSYSLARASCPKQVSSARRHHFSPGTHTSPVLRNSGRFRTFVQSVAFGILSSLCQALRLVDRTDRDLTVRKLPTEKRSVRWWQSSTAFVAGVRACLASLKRIGCIFWRVVEILFDRWASWKKSSSTPSPSPFYRRTAPSPGKGAQFGAHERSRLFFVAREGARWGTDQRDHGRQRGRVASGDHTFGRSNYEPGDASQ